MVINHICTVDIYEFYPMFIIFIFCTRIVFKQGNLKIKMNWPDGFLFLMLYG